MSKSGLKKIVGVLIGIFLVGLLIAFYQLGGFRPVVMELIPVYDYQLAGRYFNGSFRSDSIRIYFNQMSQLVQQNKLKGQPVIIYDQEPDGSRGLSKSFIGVLLRNEQGIPPDLEKREIFASNAIRLSKDAHISVMPKPHKIAERINDFCEQHNAQSFGPSIEIYYPNNRLVIEQPVRVND